MRYRVEVWNTKPREVGDTRGGHTLRETEDYLLWRDLQEYVQTQVDFGYLCKVSSLKESE